MGARYFVANSHRQWESSTALNKQMMSTAVPNLDLFLGGGIPARQSIIVTGDPGTGKTILCSQIAFAQAGRGARVVLATVASESQDKLIEELQGFSFFDPNQIGNGIYLVSAYPWLQKGPKEAKELLLKTVRDQQAALLLVDGLRALRDLWNSEAKLRDFLYELNVGLAQLEAISLLTTEYGLHTLMNYPEATTVDGVISLSAPCFAGRSAARPGGKLRGRAHLTGEHLLHIRGDGISIVPRIEETTTANLELTPSPERTASGLPELDSIIHGGLPRTSTTLMAGSTGVGKTLLATQFLRAGAAQHEPGLLLNYSEPKNRLIQRAKSVALDVEPYLDRGTLHIEYRPPTNVEADDLIRCARAVTTRTCENSRSEGLLTGVPRSIALPSPGARAE